MAPKEKAAELVDKYKIVLIQSDTDAGEEILCTIVAKQCALIEADELLSEHFFNDTDYADRRYKYWQEVKQEIEKL